MCFGAFFGKKSFFPLFHGGSSLRKISKKSKKFQSSKNAFNGFPKCPTCFEQALGQCFWIFLAQCSTQCISDFLDLKQRVQNPETKNMSSVCRQKTQQSFFCITARVNVRNSVSDILDWNLWVQIPELKNMSSVFRHNYQQKFFLHSRHSQNTQFHFRFSGLIIMSSDCRT